MNPVRGIILAVGLVSGRGSQQLKGCDLIERNADLLEARAGGELNEAASDDDRGPDTVIVSGAILQNHPGATQPASLKALSKAVVSATGSDDPSGSIVEARITHRSAHREEHTRTAL